MCVSVGTKPSLRDAQREFCRHGAHLLSRPGDEVLDEQVDLLHDEEVLLSDDTHATVEQQAALLVPAAWLRWCKALAASDENASA